MFCTSTGSCVYTMCIGFDFCWFSPKNRNNWSTKYRILFSLCDSLRIQDIFKDIFIIKIYKLCTHTCTLQTLIVYILQAYLDYLIARITDSVMIYKFYYIVVIFSTLSALLINFHLLLYVCTCNLTRFVLEIFIV